MSSVQNVASATFSAQFDADALFAELESASGDTFDLCVNAGMAARESLNNGRYDIGDLACHIRKRYGENRIGLFADEINMSASRVREYRRVCTFWQRPVRKELLEEMPILEYSTVRDSIRFNDTAMALAFLRKCVNEDWKCDRAHIEANRLLGKETLEMFKVLDTDMPGHELFALHLGVSGGMDSRFRLVVYQYSDGS